jgi:hypothetical protein
MSVVKIVRYATTPEAADENARLVRDVYAELAQTRPDGLRYATFRLDDGVTFVHLAVLDAEENPLSSTAAFARFQADIGERRRQLPVRRRHRLRARPRPCEAPSPWRASGRRCTIRCVGLLPGWSGTQAPDDRGLCPGRHVAGRRSTEGTGVARRAKPMWVRRPTTTQGELR